MVKSVRIMNRMGLKEILVYLLTIVIVFAFQLSAFSPVMKLFELLYPEKEVCMFDKIFSQPANDVRTTLYGR